MLFPGFILAVSHRWHIATDFCQVNKKELGNGEICYRAFYFGGEPPLTYT